MVDKPITPHWTGWGVWQIHKVHKAKGTTTYARYRYYYEPRDPDDPTKGSKITETDVQYKTERTPRIGEPSGIPRKPREVTPVKKEPTPEYVEPVTQVGQELKYKTFKGWLKSVEHVRKEREKQEQWYRFIHAFEQVGEKKKVPFGIVGIAGYTVAHQFPVVLQTTGERLEVISHQLRGPIPMGGTRQERLKRFVKQEQRYQSRVAQLSQERYRQLQESGDWGKLALRFISAPLVMVPVTHFAFKGVTWMGGKLVPGVKYVVRKTPVIYEKTKQVYPSVFRTDITETGKVVATRPAKIVSGFGRTRFWYHTYGWATGELKRVKVVPLIGKPKWKPFDEGFEIRKEYYRGIPKTEWYPKTLAERYKPYGEMGLRYVETPTRGLGVESKAFFQVTTRPRGWFVKRFMRQTVKYREFEPLPLETVEPVTTLYKHPGFIGRITTPGITVPSVSPKTPWSKFVGEYISTEFGKGVPVKTVQRFWLSPEKPWHLKVLGIKPSVEPVSFIESKVAAVSLVKPVRIMKPSIGVTRYPMIPAYVKGTEMAIPSVVFRPQIPTGVLVRTPLFVYSAIRGIEMIQRPQFIQEREPVSKVMQDYDIDLLQLQLVGQVQIQRQRQEQKLIQRQMQKQRTVLVTTPVIPPSIVFKPPPTPTPKVSVPTRIPFVPFIPKDEIDIKKKKKPMVMEPLGRGYRFRRHPVPEIEKFVKKSMKNNME